MYPRTVPAGEVRRFNVCLVVRVYVDFTDTAKVRDRLVETKAVLEVTEEELKEKEAELEEKEAELKEKEAALEEKEEELEEKEETINELEEQLAEKESTLEEKEAALEEKEAALEEKDRVIRELKEQLRQLSLQRHLTPKEKRPVGHLCCLKCIQQLRKPGCPLSCPLPSNIYIPYPSFLSDVRRLNVSLARRVYVDFTDTATARDRLPWAEEELRCKDRIIQDLTEQLLQVRSTLNEDRAYYKRALEEERAASFHAIEATLISAVTAQLDLLPSKLKPFLTPTERVAAAVSADDVLTTENDWESGNVQVNPPTPPEPVASVRTASIIQAGGTEVQDSQAEQASSTSAPLECPPPVLSFWGSLENELEEQTSVALNKTADSVLSQHDTSAKNNVPSGKGKGHRPFGVTPAMKFREHGGTPSLSIQRSGLTFGSITSPVSISDFPMSKPGFYRPQYNFQVSSESDASR